MNFINFLYAILQRIKNYEIHLRKKNTAWLHKYMKRTMCIEKINFGLHGLYKNILALLRLMAYGSIKEAIPITSLIL